MIRTYSLAVLVIHRLRQITSACGSGCARASLRRMLQRRAISAAPKPEPSQHTPDPAEPTQHPCRSTRSHGHQPPPTTTQYYDQRITAHRASTQNETITTCSTTCRQRARNHHRIEQHQGNARSQAITTGKPCAGDSNRTAARAISNHGKISTTPHGSARSQTKILNTGHGTLRVAS